MLLLLDWDDTITAQDTLSLIAPPDADPPFQHYTKCYLKDLSSFAAAFGPIDNVEKLYAYLKAIDQVEVASVARVESGMLFRGVKETDLLERASRVLIRKGFASFSKSFLSRPEVECHIISVGWSAKFIRKALRNLGLPGSIPKVRSNPENSTMDDASAISQSICANEIEMNDNKAGTGKMTKSCDISMQHITSGIRTGFHKLQHLQHYKSETKAELCVYIGDSLTDLPCLLAADYGLVMGDNSSMTKMCHRLNINIYEGAIDLKQNLIRISDWKEAQDWLEAILSK